MCSLRDLSDICVEQLSKASQGCPSWLKQWEERSALRLRLLTAIWILSWRSSRLCKGKLMVLEIRTDIESSRGIGMRLLAPRLNNRNLIFFGSPEPALASAKAAAGKSTLGRALQWDALAFLPHSTDTDYKLLHIHTHTHIYMHSPPHPRSLASVALNRQPDKRVCDQRRNWLQGRMAACQSWITSPVAKSCVYGVLCAFVAEVFFLFSHCTPQGA